jgi:hypothetical protein
MAEKMQLNIKSLRNVWFKSLDVEDLDDAVEEGAPEGEPIYDENNQRAVVFTTPLYSEQEAIEVQYKMSVPGSRNHVLYISKKKCSDMQEQLKIKGVAKFGNLTVSAMSTLQQVDTSKHLPIYFNSAEHTPSADKVPSTVLCYDTGKPGYWCFRHVEGVAENEKVATIHDKDWKVLESLVYVRKVDTAIQCKLRKVGFHILETGQGEMDAREGTVVMGRHELIRSDDEGTRVDGTDFELQDGVLFEKMAEDEASSDDEAKPVAGASANTIPTGESSPGRIQTIPIGESSPGRIQNVVTDSFPAQGPIETSCVCLLS